MKILTLVLASMLTTYASIARSQAAGPYFQMASPADPAPNTEYVFGSPAACAEFRQLMISNDKRFEPLSTCSSTTVAATLPVVTKIRTNTGALLQAHYSLLRRCVDLPTDEGWSLVEPCRFK